ncbi:MAG: cellulose biosynthesis protein BcsN [Devosiaceae bacterium]
MPNVKRSISTHLRTIALAGTVALSGCAQGLDGLIASQESDSFLLTGSVNQTTPATALASLPREAGRVLSVREQRQQNGLQQHIVLSGDALASGENWIKVDIGANRVQQAPSHHQLHSEMVASFGGQALPLYNYIITNEHGPVGLAFGPVSSHGKCAYIWQEVAHNDVQATEQLPFARTSGVWSVRSRLCRERLTLDHAVAFAQGLSLGAFSDPLYAPMAAAAPVDPATLASLDEPAPTVRTAQAPRSRVRAEPPTPVARATSSASDAVPIALPGAPTPTATPAPSAPIFAARPAITEQASAVAIPLPQ